VEGGVGETEGVDGGGWEEGADVGDELCGEIGEVRHASGGLVSGDLVLWAAAVSILSRSEFASYPLM
jgi:hypothetical protein